MAGTRWRRIDFHLHSPGVDSFICPPGIDPKKLDNRKTFAQQYAEKLASSHIEIAALTDYNGVRAEWYVAMRDAAAEKGILLLPGAELSMDAGKGGIHILAIFPEQCEPQQINECLRSLDKKPGRPLFTGREHSEIDLATALDQALTTIRDRFNGCAVSVPLHALASP